MPRIDADRNLLFGITALQNDLIARDALIAAMNAWALEKHRPIGEILVERGALDPTSRAVLDQLINHQIARHGGDPAQSLAALSSAAGVAEDLRRAVTDSDVLASIAYVPADSRLDPHATRTPESADYAPVGPRYRKVRDHAEGGLGIVFVARDEELNREVALKEIKPKYADNLASQSRFLIEAEITGGLEHPGIVPVYGLGHYDDGRPYYAMRFIRGDSLKDAIKAFHADATLKNDPGARTLALQKLLRRFLDVCNAIAYAHNRGVLHRDLKPDNVMVGQYGETLVVDWGLAKATGRSGDDGIGPLPESTLTSKSASGSAETIPGSVVGTPGYMSPEQATGRLDLLGPPSDVYSLGATLYTLLTGQVPFADRELTDVLKKVERGEFPRPREHAPWLDPALEAIALKAMALKPSDRYPSPRALADDVERWLADEPVAAYPEPFARRARRWAGKHRTSLTTATAATLVAALLIGGFVWRRSAERWRIDLSARAVMDESARLASQAQAGDPTLWEKAAVVAQRAVDQLEAGGSPGRLREARTTLEAIQAESRVIKALEEARLEGANVKDDAFDRQARIDGYLVAFRAYGIDVAASSIEDAARRIRTSRVADALMAALDDWSQSDSRWVNVPPERLSAIARAAETDPVRTAIREAVSRRDVAALRHFCESENDRRKFGPRIHLLFDSLLSLDPEGSFPLLETILREHPSDFWLNHDLGRAYLNAEPQKAAEAVHFLSIAVALRPDSTGAHLHLGLALQGQGRLDRAVAEYREAIRLKPDLALTHNNLGNALLEQGRLDLAVAEYETVIRLKPDFAMAHSNLGLALRDQGRLDRAVAECETAIRLKPDVAKSHLNLGNALYDQGHLDRAVAEFETVIRLKPDFAEAHNNLGVILRDQGRLDRAVAEFETAIQLQPDHARAHMNLGLALHGQGRLDLAVAECEEAIRLKADDAIAHYNLGVALEAQGHLDRAIAEYEAAIRLKPDLGEPHFNLGNLLKAQGHLDRAVAEYEKAIRLKPELAVAHNNLGVAVRDQGHLDRAVAEFEEAIRLNPRGAEAHANLGLALQGQGQLDRAVAAYEETIQLWPDFAEVYCFLGSTLLAMGKFHAALESLEKGHALGSKQKGWRHPSEAWVRDARRMVELEAKLPAIMKNETTAKDSAERLALADLGYKTGRFAASARFWGEAFAETPALADDLSKGNRYNAACSASLAASGKGKDEPMPDEPAKAKLREQALGWLRADLVSWVKVLEGGNEPARKQAVLQTLAHWKEDADLAGIRDEAALAKLPETEREAFRALWADVDRLLAKARAGAP
jgi:eukaryotic-like serine/threonine-protein kinase